MVNIYNYIHYMLVLLYICIGLEEGLPGKFRRGSAHFLQPRIHNLLWCRFGAPPGIQSDIM
jgi:hypothetical protein